MRMSKLLPAWRVALYSSAIGLPLVAFAITALAILLDSSGQVPRHSIKSQFYDLPKYIAAFNWPYLALDIIATLKLRHLESIAGAQRAPIGAVIGMTIPYALAYSFWPSEMSSAHNDAGQGVGILLILLGWVVGTVGAVVGWVLGRRLEKRTDVRNDAA